MELGEKFYVIITHMYWTSYLKNNRKWKKMVEAKINFEGLITNHPMLMNDTSIKEWILL